MAEKRLSREAIARLEVGQTDISRILSRVLTIFFLLSIFLVPLMQYWLGGWSHDELFLPSTGADAGATFVERVNSKNKQVLKGMDGFEKGLEEQSFLRDWSLPPLQYLFMKYLGQGSEKVVAGKDGWLFYRPGVDSLVGQPFLDDQQLTLRQEGHEIWEKSVQPDPLEAIIHFNEQLSQRGIRLLVVPIPIKPSLHPEKLSERSYEGRPVNRSWNTFIENLEDSGVASVDVRPVLEQCLREDGAAFLTTDTHWLPEAMEKVAKKVSEQILSRGFLEKGDSKLQLQKVLQTGEGDISKMLIFPQNTALFGEQEVELHQVLNEENEFWQPERDSELLVLGDSFTNIYSATALGWGFGAGFAEHLSYNLEQPVDLLARNDSGAYVTREMLAAELARGRDRLAGKKVVVWQFAERELALGNWKRIDLKLVEGAQSDFFVVEAGNTIEVQGTISSISRSPRPGSVPYRDNLVTMHLVDVQTNDNSEGDGQALVYGLGMKDNNLTSLSSLRPNDSVTLLLSSWDEIEGQYGSYRRSPLEDEMMELELPNWGMIKDEKAN